MRGLNGFRAGTGVIHIEIQRQPSLLDEENAPISNFVIRDNGVGFNDRNFDSFNTLYSDHKMKEGGKGLGRFTWLKAFDHVEIETTFNEKEGHFSRKFIFDEGYDIAPGGCDADGQYVDRYSGSSGGFQGALSFPVPPYFGSVHSKTCRALFACVYRIRLPRGDFAGWP